MKLTEGLSSETKCNTPADLIIGTGDQNLRECCHEMLFAFVGDEGDQTMQKVLIYGDF